MRAAIKDLSGECGYLLFSIQDVIGMMRDERAADGPTFILLRGDGWRAIAESEFRWIEVEYTKYLGQR